MLHPFIKYQATGNDFILFDNFKDSHFIYDRVLVASLCHRQRGIGADGIITLDQSDGYDFALHHYNADGSRGGGLCGNASRAVLHYAHSVGLISRHATFMAFDGAHSGFVENDLVTLLTMLQSRMQSSGRVSKYDVKFYVEKACEYLKIYQTRPQNIVSGKLVSYFKSVEEDFHQYLDSKTFDISPIIYNRYKNLRQVKRVQWVSRNIDDPESISEHTFNTWLMAMLFLPDEYDSEDYNKKEILDMLLVHDLAEAVLGDQEIKLNEPQKELKAQNEELRKLFLKGTYPDIANLTYYYNVWTGYYNGININARAARDLNLLQTVYTFCEYCCEYPEKFSVDDIKSWLNEKTNLKTEIGHRLFKRLVTDNKAFEYVIKQSETQN